MNIGDLFYLFRGEGSQLLLDAQKSGAAAADAAGKAFSARYGGAVKAGGTIAFAALAAGSAIAGRGLLELNSIQADFQAETGASTAEAERAGKAINEMGGRNLQPLKEIGAALIKVHTDLGLTGDEAERTTEAFLKYATATRQEASSAVKDFDDILDAWDLTAQDAQVVMDKLIVSHQKYGGSIAQNQKDLANLAPQLKGLNLSIDDGIGLLNLFAASGLDASKAQFALNSAIQKIPPGTTLNDVIARLSAIEDPAKRADEAIKIFGARGGAALANILRPGITSLNDFEVSATDAAGATEKAAGAIEGSFSNQVALKIKAVGSAIIGVGQTIGPLGSALTGLVSLGGALGFDKLGPKLVGGLAGIWKAAAGSAVLGPIIARAGSAAATLYLRALIAGDAFSAAVAKLWAAPAIQAAASAAGAAAGLAFAAAVVAVPIVVSFNYVSDQQSNVDLINQITRDAQTATLEALKGMRERLAAALAREKDRFDPFEDFFGLSQQNNLEQQLAALDALIAAGVDNAAADAVAIGPAVTDGLAKGTPATLHSIRAFAGKVKDDLAGAGIAEEARRQGNLASGAYSQGILDKRQGVDDAWNSLLDLIKNSQSVTAQTARLTGQLASKELIAGLHDADPAVRAKARETKQLILDQLAELKPRSGTLSKEAWANLRKAMKSADPDIRRAATDIYNAAISGPAKVPAKMTQYGSAAGKAYAAGLRSTYGIVNDAANYVAKGAVGPFKASSPPGPESPLHLIDVWGAKTGQAWIEPFADAIVRGRASLVAAVAGVGAVVMGRRFASPTTALGGLPSLSGAVPAMALAGGVPALAEAGPREVHYHYESTAYVEGLVKARDPLEIARELGRFARNAQYRPKLEPVTG